VQDPPLYNGQPLRAPGYKCISFITSKLRVCTYITFRVLLDISFVVVPKEQEIQYKRIFAKKAFLLRNNRFYGIIDTYVQQAEGGHTVTAKDLFIERNKPTLVVRDLNIHTHYTNPVRSREPRDRRSGDHYIRPVALQG